MESLNLFNGFDPFPTPIFLINDHNEIIYINYLFKTEFGDEIGKNYICSLLSDKMSLNKDQKILIISKKGHLFNLNLMPYRCKKLKGLKLGILNDVTEMRKLKEYIQYLEDLNKGMNEIYNKQQKIIDKLSQQALTDGLTGLFNHRFFWERVNVELKRASRYSEPLSCIMLDIDDFKLVNDRFDHQFGDTVLRKVANLIKTPLRGTDVLARYGGDEFAILLPNTDYQGSQVISKKIKDRVKHSIFETKGFSTRISISIGVSSYPVDNILNSSQLVEYADAALYDAKLHGKDHISFSHNLKTLNYIR